MLNEAGNAKTPQGVMTIGVIECYNAMLFKLCQQGQTYNNAVAFALTVNYDKL